MRLEALHNAKAINKSATNNVGKNKGAYRSLFICYLSFFRSISLMCHTDNTSTFSGTLKRVTTSAAPKYSCILDSIRLVLIFSTRNLCYIEHFNTIGPLTTTAFEAYWKKLDKDEKKVRFQIPASWISCYVI